MIVNINEVAVHAGKSFHPPLKLVYIVYAKLSLDVMLLHRLLVNYLFY